MQVMKEVQYSLLLCTKKGTHVIFQYIQGDKNTKSTNVQPISNL